MADLLDIVSLADAKRMLSIGQVDTSEDDNLERLITTVSRRLDKLVGPVVQRTVTGEQHNGGCSVVWLNLAPVFSVTTVTEDGTPLVAGVTYDVTPYDPGPILSDGTLARLSGTSETFFTPGRRNIVVTYVAGRYEDTAAVDPIFKEAAALMLRNLWKPYGESVTTINDYEVPTQNFPTYAVPQAVRELLHAYLMPEIGFG
jgi:hypothetical protein